MPGVVKSSAIQRSEKGVPEGIKEWVRRAATAAGQGPRNASHLEDPSRANQISYGQKDLIIVESIQPTGQKGPGAPGIRKCRSQAGK